MPKKTNLTDKQKETITASWKQGNSQTALAELFNVSARTIGRILREYGALAPEGMSADLQRNGRNIFTEDEQKCLQMLRDNNVDSQRLEQIFKTPTLTTANMVHAVAGFNDQTTLNFLTAVRNRRNLNASKLATQQ